MVGVSRYSDPVESSHKAIHQTGAEVQGVLNALPIPPRDLIPDINDVAAKSGHWVRYTAMVQDIWDTEIFVASSPEGKSGLLVENAAASDNPAATLAERLPVYLVSLPGETPWVRARNLHPAEQDSSAPDQHVPVRSNPNGVKRARDGDVEMNETRAPSIPAAGPPAPAPAAGVEKALHSEGKRPRPEAVSGQHALTSVGLNLPVHDQPGASAVVAKLYDSEKCRDLKIHTLVEVIGIMQDGLELRGESDQPDDFAAEFAARNPRNVKRLHTVKWRELEPWEIHPLTCSLEKTGLASAKQEAVAAAGEMRDMIVKYLASALLGDGLAAEYLLMCMLSRPKRVESTLLGKMSLNLVLPSSMATQGVSSVLGAVRNLCSPVVEVPVNIAGLNSVDLFPKKDYTMNRLKAGALQLAPGSCLFGNECALSVGRLAERGVKNVRALTAVSKRCMIPIDFQYYETELGVDCCSVFVSSGGKSIIPADVVIRVQEQKEGAQLKAWDSYDADSLRKMRLALMLLVEDGVFDIHEDATKEVERVYVEARKVGQAKDGQETLQKWLSIARCCARSYGEQSLSAERWRQAVDMERRREQRTKK